MEAFHIRLFKQPRDAAFWCAALAISLAAILAAQSLLVIAAYVDPVPTSDAIDVLWRYFHGPARQFWFYHGNEHVMLAVMPIYWADFVLFHANGVLPSTLCLIFAILIAALPALVAWRAHPGAPSAAAGAAFLACTLWLGNRWNLVFPLQLHMYTSLLSVVAALCLAARPAAAGLGRAAALALLLAVASLSFGYGIAGFPAVGAVALLRRWKWPSLFVLGAGAALCLLVIYAILVDGGVITTAGGTPEFTKASRAFSADYALAFLGGPAANVARYAGADIPSALWTGRICALSLLVVLALHFLWCWRRRLLTVPSALALGLLVFCLLNAALTSYGRSFFGVTAAIDERYILGQLPLIFAAVLVLVEDADHRRWPGTLIAAAAAVAIGVLLLNQQNILSSIREWNARLWILAAAQITGAMDLQAGYTEQLLEPGLLPFVNANLKRERWGAFAFPQVHWLGRAVASWGPPATGCAGRIEGAPAAAGDGQRLSGWAEESSGATGGHWLILADAAGIVRGLGHDGLTHGSALVPGGPPNYGGWTGYAMVPPGVPLTPYLMLQDRHPCVLVREANP